MNKEYDWDHTTEADVVKRPTGKVVREKMAIAKKSNVTTKGSWTL